MAWANVGSAGVSTQVRTPVQSAGANVGSAGVQTPRKPQK